MNLRRLALKNVFSHQDTLLDVPPAGVVLITGHNGSGKSSLIEAPCVALFNKTLRGSPPWTDGVGHVFAEFDMVKADRHHAGKRTALRWVRGSSEQATDYENTTKAQEALERVVGSFDVWRRSRVFSSSDAAHFTLATDAERKRLLETILGVDRFDAAYETCRAAFRTVEAKQAQTMFAATSAQQRLDAAGKGLERAQKVLADLEEAATLDQVDARAVGKLTKLVEGAEATVHSCSEQLMAINRSAGSLSADARAAQLKLERLGDKPSCTTCGQAIDPKVRENLRRQVAKEQAELNRERDQNATRLQELSEAKAEAEEERRALSKQLAELGQRAAKARQQAAEVHRARISVHEHEDEVNTWDQELEMAQGRLKADMAELAELGAVSTVLGLKGVRAQVLGRALVGVEAVANAWLARLPLEDGRRIQLQLMPYQEKKTGGTTDAICIKVSGAGGEHGYAAASGGERRRIDVALVFGFSAVAMEAQEADAGRRLGGEAGVTTGTTFWDEVGDALDDCGVDALCDALVEFARDRAVLVVTHNERMIANLDPDGRPSSNRRAAVQWKVANGVVTVV